MLEKWRNVLRSGLALPWPFVPLPDVAGRTSGHCIELSLQEKVVHFMTQTVGGVGLVDDMERLLLLRVSASYEVYY